MELNGLVIVASFKDFMTKSEWKKCALYLNK